MQVKGREKIDWTLLTDLSVRSCLDAIGKLEWYAQRRRARPFGAGPVQLLPAHPFLHRGAAWRRITEPAKAPLAVYVRQSSRYWLSRWQVPLPLPQPFARHPQAVRPNRLRWGVATGLSAPALLAPIHSRWYQPHPQAVLLVSPDACRWPRPARDSSATLSVQRVATDAMERVRCRYRAKRHR